MKLKTTNLAVALALSTAMVMPAQTSSSGQSNGDFFEINLFGGAHFFKRQNDPPNQDHATGGLSGFRLVQNIWNYVSLEQTGMVHGTANLVYRVPNTNQDYALGARLRQFHFNPVLHMTPRESRVRPFLTMGFGWDYFGITDAARAQVGNGVNTPFQQLVRLESQFRPAFNYGGGIKAKLTDRVGLRFDVRGFATASPSFGVPGSAPGNGIFYSRTTPQNALQTTGGLTFYLGAIDQGPVCEFRVGSIEPSSATVWLTESATYRTGVTNSCMGVTPKYKWMMDGQPVDGTDAITVRGVTPGDKQIKVMVEADTTNVTDRKTRNFLRKFPISAVERTATLTVKKPVLELVSIVINPSTIPHNGTATVTSTIRYDGPAAGDTILMTYSATDGCLSSPKPSQTVSGDMAALEAAARANPNQAAVSSDCRSVAQMVQVRPGNTTDTVRFDASKVQLTAGGPSKTVTVNGSAKDKDGAASSKSGNVTVNAPPAPAPPPAAPPKLVPIQLDDVIFSRNGARVNNCGKRIIDQAYERAAAMGDYDVLLVGHFDSVERNVRVRDPRTRASRTLDQERALNVAAVLSAGVEPCKRLSRDRIKVAYVGNEQLSPYKTSLCEATVKERGGSRISAADGNAKNRRVEIWLVPRGGDMPNGIGGIQNAPVAEIQSKGCPK